MESNYPRPNLSGLPPCPRCGQPIGRRIRYVWWGGAVAPAIMCLTKCTGCGMLYNGKTGLSAKKAITVYNVIAVGLGLLALLAVYLGDRR